MRMTNIESKREGEREKGVGIKLERGKCSRVKQLKV